jgi:hypothetical protein
MRSIVNQYIKKQRFAEIMTIQYAIYRGLYLTKYIDVTTQRFNDYILSKYKVVVDQKLLTSWIPFLEKRFSEITAD